MDSNIVPDLKSGKWYIVSTPWGLRALEFIGKRGVGHFRTRAGFDFWADRTKLVSGPYGTITKADSSVSSERRKRHDTPFNKSKKDKK